MVDLWEDSDEEPLVEVALSESPSDIRAHDDQRPRFPLAATFEPAEIPHSVGTTPPSQSILDSVDESNSANETSLTTEALTPTKTYLTSQAEPVTDSPKSPARQGKTFIHPIYEGGSVTWKDHNDLVFRKGKERGPRVPTPSLPKGFKSMGPLSHIDFTKLRDNHDKKKAVISFLDNYTGKQEKVPTELVTEIMAYYNFLENDRLKSLTDQALKIQELADTIKVQEKEVEVLKEEGSVGSEGIRKLSAQREGKINQLSQDIRDKEDTINKLFLKIHSLESIVAKQTQEFRDSARTLLEEKIGNLALGAGEKEGDIDELLLKISGLEISVGTQERQNLESGDAEQSSGEHVLDEILMARRRRRNAYGKQKEEGSPYHQDDDDSSPTLSKRLMKQADEIRDSLLESTIRVLVIQGKRYMEHFEASAALGIFERADRIANKDLPERKILRGKVLYHKGRALFELRAWREAAANFEAAVNLGFVSGCGELDGDSTERFLQNARRAMRRSSDLTWVPKHKESL